MSSEKCCCCKQDCFAKYERAAEFWEKIIRRICYDHNNMYRFKTELQNANWDDILRYVDTNSAYQVFINRYISIYNRCFPLKRVKARKSTLNKPWLTKDLQKSIKKKNVLNKRFLSNPHLVLRSVIGNIEIN